MNFKTITHYFAVAIVALAGFALTPAGKALVTQYPKLSVFFGVVGGLAALYHSPKVAAVVMLFLVLCSPGFAQTNAVPQQHFSLSGSAVSFMGPNGSAPATIADGYVNITKSWSAGYQQIIVPQLATFKFGMIDLTKPLPSLLGKKLTAKLQFDATQWTIDFYGGAGKVNQGTLGVDRIAETLGVCATRKLTANVSAKLVCGQFLHGGTVTGLLVSGIPTGASSSTAAVSSGISLHF